MNQTLQVINARKAIFLETDESPTNVYVEMGVVVRSLRAVVGALSISQTVASPPILAWERSYRLPKAAVYLSAIVALAGSN